MNWWYFKLFDRIKYTDREYDFARIALMEKFQKDKIMKEKERSLLIGNTLKSMLKDISDILLLEGRKVNRIYMSQELLEGLEAYSVRIQRVHNRLSDYVFINIFKGDILEIPITISYGMEGLKSYSFDSRPDDLNRSPLLEYWDYPSKMGYFVSGNFDSTKQIKSQVEKNLDLMVSEIKRLTEAGYNVTDVAVNSELYAYMMDRGRLCHPEIQATVSCGELKCITILHYGARRIIVNNVKNSLLNGFRVIIEPSAKPKGVPTNAWSYDIERCGVIKQNKEKPPVDLLEHMKSLTVYTADHDSPAFIKKRFPIQTGRRVGNTTRMADEAIQLLFEGKSIKVVDHSDNTMSSLRLYNMIIDRIRKEHGYAITQFEFNTNKLTIKPMKKETTEKEKFMEKIQQLADKAKFWAKDDNRSEVSVVITKQQQDWLLEEVPFIHMRKDPGQSINDTVAKCLRYEGIKFNLFIKDKTITDLTI